MPDLDTRFRSFGKVPAPELWPEIARREPAPPSGPPLRPRIVAAVVALLVAAAGFAFAERALSGGGSAAHRPASAPAPDRIAFSAYRDGSWNIFSVNPDGSDLRKVTDLSATDEFAPAWSPDGSKIVFVSQRAGSAADADLWVIDAGGSGLTKLTSNGTNWDPTWSPDGTQIAFRKAIDGDQEIYVVGADGSGEKDISRSPNSWELAPSWSPDGSRIAFTSVRGNDQGPQIYVMNADGTGAQQLTDSADPHDSPQWSPDGTRIAFATQRSGVWGVDVMNADGSGVQRVAETPGRGASPSWSPDGTQIAYETGSVHDDFAQLNVVNADGSDPHTITDHQFSDLCCASWAGASSSLKAGESPLQAEGTSMTLPEGWHGRIDSLPGYPRRMFQAATFPLPPLEDIEATGSRSAMGSDDVLIVLAEYANLSENLAESSGLPIVIGAEDVHARTHIPKWLPSLDDVQANHALARRIFSVPPESDPAHTSPRYFDLRVEFGSVPVTQEALDRVNAILASLTVGEWVPEPNGVCQWHDLGMEDPDCPQPNWLREVLSVAGSRITEEGGTFVARSGGAEFFIWVKEADQVRDSPESFPIQETIQGVRVYGHSQGWEWSTGRLRVFIAEGPYGDSRLPSLDELRPIVRASLEVSYEPAAA